MIKASEILCEHIHKFLILVTDIHNDHSSSSASKCITHKLFIRNTFNELSNSDNVIHVAANMECCI